VLNELGSRRSFQMLLLAVASLATDYGRYALGPIQEAMRVALGLSDNEMALLQGTALALPQVIVAVPLGLMVDRYSRVRLLWIFAAMNLGGSVLTAIGYNFGTLFAARFVIGFAVTATGPAAFSLIGDLYPPSSRGRAAMVFNVGGCAGQSIVFALGGALLAATHPGVDAWRSVMLRLSGLLMAVVVLMLALREPTRTDVAVAGPSVRGACRELWHYRRSLVPLMSGWVLVQMGGIAAVIWAAPTLSRSFALSPDRIGAIMATTLFVSGVAGPLVGGLLADYCQRSGGPPLTMGCLSVLAFVTLVASTFPLVPTVGAAGSALFILITLVTAISTTALTLTIVIVPNELRGLCISLYTVTGAVGFGVAPLSVSMLSNAIGGPAKIGEALAIVGGTAAALATGAFAMGRRHLGAGSVAA
jgi:MFS family permease